MMAQLELKQNFSKFIDGLSARIMGNTSRYAAFDMQMAYNPFYYTALYNRETKTYTLNELNPNTGTEYLNYSPGDKTINYSLYSEGSLNYSHTFGADHDVSGMLVGMIRQYLTANATNLSDALPERNLGLSGRFTYGYGKRYFAEFNFGYNGSEKFDKGHRWGFFPSFGVGWTVSNEDFWTSLKDYVSLFKLRGTYGLVGNDAIGGQRFFYISKVTSGGGGSFTTGKDFNGATISGYKIDNYANSNITWEISYKTNIGIELGLLKDKLMLQADIFNEHRTNILQSRADIPTEQGLWVTPLVNLGEANGSGVDVSLDYNHNFNKDLWMVGRANFTYARSTYAKYEEVPYAEMGAPWRTRVGRSVSQQWGYIAEKLFIDDYLVQNSARQNFGQYGAGDIKYKDLNNDGTIDELDMAPIGYPSTPEINYGFGLSAGYKGFDASFFFSGSDRSSFFINSTDISPFITRTADGRTLEGGLIKYIADSHWTEQGQDPYAKWPRLSNTIISNNVQTSTWYMYDNHYLRLKSVELGWSMPDKTAHALRLASLRIYASGSNLALFSNFKLWDVEMGSSGLNYPIQRVINVGLNVGF